MFSELTFIYIAFLLLYLLLLLFCLVCVCEFPLPFPFLKLAFIGRLLICWTFCYLVRYNEAVTEIPPAFSAS